MFYGIGFRYSVEVLALYIVKTPSMMHLKYFQSVIIRVLVYLDLDR